MTMCKPNIVYLTPNGWAYCPLVEGHDGPCVVQRDGKQWIVARDENGDVTLIEEP